MTLRASSAKLALDTGGDPAAATAAFADVTSTGRRVLDELRGLLSVLRDPDALDTPWLVADPESAIEDAVEQVRAAGVVVGVTIEPGLTEASLLTRATIARVVQEGLTNILKHAGPGTSGTLTVATRSPATLVAQIHNERPPQRQPRLPASGHGLAGMRDRVALLGGVLVAGPTPDRGWSLRVELPSTGDR